MTPRPKDGQTSGAGALALVVLVCLLAPAGMPLFAGFIHTAYHALTAAPPPPHSHAAPDARVVHSHVPGGELHTHAVVVDRAIALAGDGAEPAMGPTSSSQQLDRHVPSAVAELTGPPEVASVDPEAAVPLHGHLNSAPPVPPPRG